MFRLVGLFSCLLLFIAACAPTLMNTPTGGPEAFFQNASREEVINALTDEMIMQGYQTKSITDYTLVFGKEEKSGAGQIFYGSRFNPFPEQRVTYTLLKLPEGIRVVATVKLVTNPGSGYEKATDFTYGWNYAKDVQRILDRVKSRMYVQKLNAGPTKKTSSSAKKAQTSPIPEGGWINPEFKKKPKDL
ncbi:MAG: hypothetical protein JRI66_10875 [Deltaproteobacteria bacterium]|nr:hypothetical protein [Deltaproteobacteria bacterium]